ncbi:serine hydrolase domain-containing protein [Brucella cytisi]|uniref:serine hydrolase domain-containing protein n=1 Tax=Brucella cytisi TaxID=407152 RepID=UPI0035E2FB81
MSETFQQDYGFCRQDVGLANWRERPFSTWGFRHIPELIPTAEIAAAPGLVEEPKVDGTWLTSSEFAVDDRKMHIRDILDETFTDALVVMKGGKIVAEFHAPNFTTRSRHILFSASKSVTGILAGILVADGLLDPDELISHYVPELKRSAFGDARVRQALDMRTSLVFTEDYGDPRGDFARYRRAGLLDPALDGEPVETVITFLASLNKAPREHGGPFFYCSPNSDVAGLVVERAAGRRFPDLMAERLWQPLAARSDARITVDREGTARAGGGLFMTVRDFARVGDLMRCGGLVDGRQIVPSEWVRDTAAGGDRQSWVDGNFASWLPAGRYRNQWYQSGNPDGAFFALGIHGQWLWVNPRAELVIAKFSSQPVAAMDAIKHLNITLFNAIVKLL